MKDNPFSLNFGKEPYKMVSRQMQLDEIIETFESDTPSSSTYIITGVRGSGKTVTMMSVMNEMKNKKKWITITLNPSRDLLTSLAANLYENPLVKPAFIKADIGINFVISASLTSDGPSADTGLPGPPVRGVCPGQHWQGDGAGKLRELRADPPDGADDRRQGP